MPAAYCLDRLTSEEIGVLFNGLRMHGFVPEGDSFPSSREEGVSRLLEVMQSDGFVEKALDCLPEMGRRVLGLIIAHGGTSGSYYDVLHAYTAGTTESNSFWAGLRSLMRLGLAFIFHGQYRPHIVLAEGVGEAAQP
jgi:hypothetical protein